MATTDTWVGSGDVRVTAEGQQAAPAAAGLPGGGYVLAWIVSGDGFSQVHAQGFDAVGNKLGAETVVAQGPAYGTPGVVALADGGFVVTWDSRTDAAAPTNYLQQRFGPDGAAVGAATAVNALPDYDTSSSAEPLALAGGGWVVQWSQNPGGATGWGPQLQVYAPSGAPTAGNESIGYEADGTPYGTGSYIHSSALAATADGGFVSVWSTSDAYQPGAGTTDHVYVQRFNAAGTPLGAPVEAVTEPGSSLAVSGVETAVLAGSGQIVISVRGVLADGRSEITTQRFDGAGQALAAPQAIVSATAVLDSKVTALSDGSFVVSWMDSQVTQDLKQQQTVYAQHYDSQGTALGAQLLVGTSQAIATHYTVTATPGGGAEFAWDDARADAGDVYAEHFASSAAGDQVPPTVVAFSPADNAGNVPLNT
ncbi:MAG TPA: hypothetical protein VLU41_02800, partial [Ideonella sp.]|nr:hypothetical protein [Ideonella sp.]